MSRMMMAIDGRHIVLYGARGLKKRLTLTAGEERALAIATTLFPLT